MTAILKAAEAELQACLTEYEKRVAEARAAFRRAKEEYDRYEHLRSECHYALTQLRDFMTSSGIVTEVIVTLPSETGNIDRTRSDVSHQEGVQ